MSIFELTMTMNTLFVFAIVFPFSTMVFSIGILDYCSAMNDDVGFFSLKEWDVPDFCQFVLMATPERFEERKVLFRRLVFAMRRSTWIIHQRLDLARKYYKEFVGGDEDETKQEEVMEVIMTATLLPAFPNDNSMSSDYYSDEFNTTPPYMIEVWLHLQKYMVKGISGIEKPFSNSFSVRDSSPLLECHELRVSFL